MSKKKIREGCFETNSSSLHTLCIRGKKNIRSDYQINYILETTLGEYGWDGPTLYHFYDKLKYALLMILYTEYPHFNPYDEEFIVDQAVLEGLAGYKLLIDAIRKHGDCYAIIIKRINGAFYPYGYIDHQSYEDYNSLQDFLDDWRTDAESLLFDDNISIQIDNDNH